MPPLESTLANINQNIVETFLGNHEGQIFKIMWLDAKYSPNWKLKPLSNFHVMLLMNYLCWDIPSFKR